VEAATDDCGLVQCDPTVHDSLHVIVFDDAAWPHNDPNNTLALTTVTYGVDSGQIYDADMEINTAEHSITATEPPPAGSYDLQAILTHEAGHFFGLAHATSATPIMYARYQPGAVTLTSDDVDGICSMYPPITKSGCACTSTPSGGGAGAVVAGTGLAMLLGARRRRRRQVPVLNGTGTQPRSRLG
jgi:MYXO-CTERM domain-containing protein